MARKTEFGEVVRYVPAPEPLSITAAIGILTLLEMLLVAVFIVELADAGNEIYEQQFLAFVLATALLNLAGILTLYRRYFLPDVMLVKKRKNKYEDLM